MKINWKEACKCPGYVSLKAMLIRDSKTEYRKGEALKQFKWVISRAIHYAYHLNKSFEEVINEWESKRKYCWYNFYQNAMQPKLNKSPLVKPMSARTRNKKDVFGRSDVVYRKKLNLKVIVAKQQQESKRKGKKARWNLEAKVHQKRLNVSVS